MPQAHPKYNHQIIIYVNYVDPLHQYQRSTSYHYYKWVYQRGYDKEHCHYLTITANDHGTLMYDTEAWIAAFKHIDTKTRIYIVGHCKPGSNSIFGSNDNQVGFSITATELASLIKTYIPLHLIINLNMLGHKLRVSLLACYAGRPSKFYLPKSEQINNSFAAILSYKLNLIQGIKSDVVARTGLFCLSVKDFFQLKDEHILKLTIKPENEDSAIKYVQTIDSFTQTEGQTNKENSSSSSQGNVSLDSLYHNLKATAYPPNSPISKIVYTYVGTQQVIKPAYFDKSPLRIWRENLIETLYECYHGIKDESTQFDILRLIARISLLPDSNLYSEVQKILAKTTQPSHAKKSYDDKLYLMQLYGLFKTHPKNLSRPVWPKQH